MTPSHYSTLLALYKKKVSGTLTEKEVSDALLQAKIDFDKAFVNNETTKDIQEFINDLNLL